jgi:cytochrome b6-f complex iron-sulfur subunit
MDYQSGVVYSTAGDVYVKKIALRKVILRSMVILLMSGLFIYPLIRYLASPQSAARYQDAIQIPLANLPAGTSQLIAYHGQPVIVINNHGSIQALSALCTYSDSLLSWDKDREELVCPSQDARFDLNGNVKAGLAPRPLERIKVIVVEGKVIIGGI